MRAVPLMKPVMEDARKALDDRLKGMVLDVRHEGYNLRFAHPLVGGAW